MWLYPTAMSDVHFNCPACAQPLVVEETGGGLTIGCPHCSHPLQIPYLVRGELEAQESRKLSKWIKRSSELERQLYSAQTELAETHRESEQRQIALAETLQELRVLKTEQENTLAEVSAERAGRDSLIAQLRQAQTAAADAGQRLMEISAERDRLDIFAQQLDLELSQKQKQLDVAHAERNSLLVDFAQKSAALADLGAELDLAQGERNELDTILHRVRHELAQSQKQSEELQAENASLSSELVDVRAEFRHLQTSFSVTREERDHLAEAVRLDHELSDLLSAKAARQRVETELRDVQVVLNDTREKLHIAAMERDLLRRETVELQLKLSALRDSASQTELVQDNELLRGIIERLQEELKDRPAPRRRRGKKESSTKSMSAAMRAVWARCFISDPDTI